MPYKTSWLIPERIVITKLWGNVSLEDVQNISKEVEEKVEEGTPLVHHISDSLDAERFEFSLKTFQVMFRSARPLEGMGWQISVTRNPINRMTSAIVNRFVRTRYRSFDTVQEALQFLSAKDETLGEIELEESTL